MYSFIRQPKLTQSKARIEHQGYLIYPYLSIIFEKETKYQLSSLSPDEQQELLEKSVSCEIEIASEFAVCRGSENDREAIEAVQAILHAYFVTYEMDQIVERSVFRLMQDGSQETLPYHERQAILININKAMFGINTIRVNINQGETLIVNYNNSDISDDIMGKLLHSAASEVLRFRHSLSAKLSIESGSAYIHAIPTARGKKSNLEIIVILSKGFRLSPFAIKINEYMVEINRETFIRKPKTSLEKHLQKKIIESKIKKDPASEFKKTCDDVVDLLGKLTNSHSITIRKYVPFTDSLHLISGWALERERDNTVTSIRRNVGLSVNSFCYESSDEPYIYIPDLNELPERYSQKGLKQPLRTRANSVSEICIPIGVHPIRLGTLNLESPNYAAYELDIGFLERVAFLISQYWSSLTSAGDTWWLSQLSLTHLATHELRDFKETLDLKQKKILEGIISTIAPTEHYSANKDLSWNHFFKYLRRAHGKLLGSKYFYEIWQVQGIEPSDPISSRFLGSLKLIVQCILNNTRHSDYKQNRISLKRDKVGQKEIVIIEYRSMVNYLDPETIVEVERRFIQPSLSSDGWHFGLFLIGVHARLLGGDVAIDPDCRKEFDNAPFSYIVRFPIPEADND
jgi:hypothetical protein